MLPTRAHAEGLRLRQTRLLNTRYYRSLQYGAIEAWSNLPAAITVINSKRLFTKRVYMIHILYRCGFIHYIYYIGETSSSHSPNG